MSKAELTEILGSFAEEIESLKTENKNLVAKIEHLTEENNRLQKGL